MSSKITKVLSTALGRAGESRVRCAIDVAIDRDRLPLSSFAARASARDSAVMSGITAIMGTVQAWEASHGTTIEVAIRASEGIVDVVAPRSLIEVIAEMDEVAAVDTAGPKQGAETRSR